ncbi:hypothetical protein GUITHDRAFT_137234 [Guillardia theta CCMP2712]|uniref:Uncharacterized protein n=1 Tax=Guillardia theta (strain CCMP2712) TaxID=905079 RepID=L1JH98_GUITC|nr:hypothetical protein GUITHDRAFT_137234 [Guillardia theta CCMP2712]EKX47861.1 hypothetical protein GUITHDRAFT_137234 [Guillardia theta CCMP2712]|eukprot:XP_005834841.1 hypothetical protein GUITHDRAFT_137234 [Guillardia theta CCMP2712]
MMAGKHTPSARMGTSKVVSQSPAKKMKPKSSSKKQSLADTPGSATKAKTHKKAAASSEKKSILSRQTRIEHSREAGNDDCFKEELNEQLRANEQLRSENHELRIEIVSLESKLRMSQQELQSLSRQFENLAEQKQGLETSYSFKLKQSQKQTEMLEGHIRSLKSEVLEAEKGLLMRERANLQGQEDATKRFDDMLILKDREVERLKKALTDSINHSNNVTQELSRHRVMVERCKRRESELQEAIASAHREVDSLRSSLTNYEHFRPFYSSDSGRDECKVALLEQTLQSLRKELKGAIIAKEAAMEAHENEKEEKHILLDAYDKLRTDFETFQVESRSQSEEDKAAIDYLEKELTHIRHVHNMLQRDRHELENALSEHQKREQHFEELSQEIGEHREKTLLAEQECVQLRQQIETLRNDLDCSLSQSQQHVGRELHMKREVEKIVSYLTREMESSSHQKLILQKHLNALTSDLVACRELARELETVVGSSWSRQGAQPERAEMAVQAAPAADVKYPDLEVTLTSDLVERLLMEVQKEALQEQVWKLRGRLDAEETFRRELTNRLPMHELERSGRSEGVNRSSRMGDARRAGADDLQSETPDTSSLLRFEHMGQAARESQDDGAGGEDPSEAMEKELEQYKAQVSDSQNASVDNLLRFFDIDQHLAPSPHASGDSRQALVVSRPRLTLDVQESCGTQDYPHAAGDEPEQGLQQLLARYASAASAALACSIWRTTPPSTAGRSTPARPSYQVAPNGNWSYMSPPVPRHDTGIREISELAAEWRQIESRRAVLSIKEEAQARVLDALKQAGATPSALRKLMRLQAQEVLNHSSESIMNV